MRQVRAVSPSEENGLALGLKLLRFERHRREESINGELVRTNVYARFESPPLYTPGRPQRRHVLHSYSKSRAGAWMHAIRWLRQLQKGKLS